MLPRISGVPFVPDTNGAKDACEKVDREFSEKRLRDSFNVMENFCEKTRKMTQDIFDSGDALYAFVESAMNQVQIAVGLLVGLMNALFNIKAIWPAALSVGPGLLAGALRAKIIIPEASLPGILLTVLPWVYVPLSWALFNVIVQLAGDWLVVSCLFFIAFSPLGVSILCVHAAANAPMTSSGVARLTARIGYFKKAMMLIAVGLFIAFAVTSIIAYQSFLKQHASQISDLIMNKVLPLVFETDMHFDISVYEIVMAVIPIAASFITKYVLTAAVATDWMLQETAFQRKFEQVEVVGMSLEIDPQVECDRPKRLTALVLAQGGLNQIGYFDKASAAVDAGVHAVRHTVGVALGC